MTNGFEDIQKYGKENVDVALKSVDAVSKGFQALAAEATDYSKQSFSEGGAALEKMLAATSLDQAVQVQSGYLRAAYEGYVGQMTKMGEIVADMTRNAYKPYEGALARHGK